MTRTPQRRLAQADISARRVPSGRSALGRGLGLAALSLCVSVGAARSAPRGELPPRTLEDLGGERVSLFVPGEMSALLFFDPTSGFTKKALEAVGRCDDAVDDAPLRWLGVVSGRHELKAVRAALREAKVDLTVVRDEGGTSSAALHVVARPTLAVVDQGGHLVQWQPYEAVGFGDKLCARVRFALGRLSKDGLERILTPKRTGHSVERVSRAQRYIKLGRVLLRVKRLEKAEQSARSAIAADAKLAVGYSLLGQILAAREDCPGALVEYERALTLDQNDTAAIAGVAACTAEPAPSDNNETIKPSGDSP